MDIQDKIYCAEEFFEENPGAVICSGAGALMQLVPLVHELDEETVLICAGGQNSYHASGADAALKKVFGRENANTPVFEGIPAEPDTECVRQIVRMMEQEKPSAVIAIGGGSVMDAAKAAYLSWQTGKDVKELFGSSVASKTFPERSFRKVWCVPTTSGTGSEVTPYSNIIDTESGVKCLIADPAIIPEYAFLNPELTCRIPEKITVDTALDAMVHCVESLLNVSAGKEYPQVAKWAAHGISMIAETLPVLLTGNMESPLLRCSLSTAACLGGMCISLCPTSLPHLCSFSFCGKSTHGAAVAALLPHFWRYYLTNPEIAEQTMLLSHVFSGKTPAEVVDSCEKFIASVGIETAPGDLSGTDLSFVDLLAENAKLNPMKLISAPVPIDPGSAGKIFHQVLDLIWNKR